MCIAIFTILYEKKNRSLQLPERKTVEKCFPPGNRNILVYLFRINRHPFDKKTVITIQQEKNFLDLFSLSPHFLNKTIKEYS